MNGRGLCMDECWMESKIHCLYFSNSFRNCMNVMRRDVFMIERKMTLENTRRPFMVKKIDAKIPKTTESDKQQHLFYKRYCISCNNNVTFLLLTENR